MAKAVCKTKAVRKTKAVNVEVAVVLQLVGWIWCMLLLSHMPLCLATCCFARARVCVCVCVPAAAATTAWSFGCTLNAYPALLRNLVTCCFTHVCVCVPAAAATTAWSSGCSLNAYPALLRNPVTCCFTRVCVCVCLQQQLRPRGPLLTGSLFSQRGWLQWWLQCPCL